MKYKNYAMAFYAPFKGKKFILARGAELEEGLAIVKPLDEKISTYYSIIDIATGMGIGMYNKSKKKLLERWNLVRKDKILRLHAVRFCKNYPKLVAECTEAKKGL